MKVVKLETNNYQILRAISITPEGNIVTIGGKNEQGKTSILDAIWVALAGRSAAPPVPIRQGEEECRIRLDLGEIIITRKFTKKEGAPNGYTDSVRVENSEGLRYPSPQKMLDDLLGAIGFDPFAFTLLKPEKQAEALLQLVPLPVDLEEHARFDASDYARRTDVNRDAERLKARIDGIPLEEDLPAALDREKIANDLATAAEANSAIREQERARAIEDHRVEEIDYEIGELEKKIAALRTERAGLEERIEQREPLPALVNAEELRAQLGEADEIQRRRDQQARRAELVAEHAGLVEQSEGFTRAMAERKAAREKALASARMPIEGLGFALADNGKPVVTFKGLPFSQASKAAKIRASTAIAMAANPELRVLRILDGSLLDEDSMAILAELAEREDYQLWIEVVGSAGVGIVIEDGAIKGAPSADPEPDPKPEDKAKKKAPPKKPEAEAGPEKLL